MANRRISDHTALTGANLASGDLYEVVDISDTTDAATGTNKKMVASELAIGIANVGGGYAPAAYVTGQYIRPTIGSVLTFPLTANRMFLCPIRVFKTVAVDQIACNISATGGAGSVIRLGIYSGVNTPTTLVVDAGTVVASSGTGDKTITISQTLTPGMYWLAYANQVGTSPTTSYCAWAGTSSINLNSFLSSSSVAGSGTSTWYQDSVSGAFPASTSSLVADAQPPIVALRVA